MQETSVGEFVDEMFSSDNELNYAGVISAQVARINYFFSRLNETPSYVFVLWSKSDNTKDPFDYKPNIDNFIKSVMCLEVVLESKRDKIYNDEIKKIDKPKNGNDWDSSIAKYRCLIKLIKRQDMLPKEKRIK